MGAVALDFRRLAHYKLSSVGMATAHGVICQLVIFKVRVTTRGHSGGDLCVAVVALAASDGAVHKEKQGKCSAYKTSAFDWGVSPLVWVSRYRVILLCALTLGKGLVAMVIHTG